MGNKEDTWKKFCAKSLYEQLTENLFIEACDDAQGKDNVFYYLENKKNRNLLDKCFCAVSSYKGYKIYKDSSFMIRKNGNDGYDSFTVFAGRGATFRLENEDIKLSGEVLNNSTPILKKYKEDIGDNGDKKKFSELSKMFFHLVTTVGNVMPWPKGFNPVTGGRLDIFQEKFPMYLNLYEWMRMVGKLNEGWKHWIKGFVDNHYLQDFVFVNDNKTEALIFYNEKTDSNIRWNLYFYRASKAIMKRSYRILKNEEIKNSILSKNQEKEFNEKFQEFCEECNIMEELVGLIKELDKNDNKDNEGGKPEMLELDELIKKLDNLIEQLYKE